LESTEDTEDVIKVQVVHDLRRQILEIMSLLRVMNNYYDKKNDVQKTLKPHILKKFKEGLKTVENGRDWLFSLPTALNTLSEDFIKNKDSFRFPDSIILFEAWMNLGMEALYPRYVLNFKFPGFLKGEKTRNVLQFIYATSRGFGFPIYFGPEFYEYKLTIGKILEPFFKWSHTVCHKANQGIYLVGDKRMHMKRHHPGEFESVIVSEYENKIFKGIDTLLHGYFTSEPKKLGKFTSIADALQNVAFRYTIGDHAMSVDLKNKEKTISLPLITHDYIVKKYDIDFYSYIEKLMEVNRLLIKKITHYKKIRKDLINRLKKIDKLKYRLEQSKDFAKRFAKMAKKLSKKYPEIDKYGHYMTLMEKLRELLFTTPLYMHTVHTPKEQEDFLKFTKQKKEDLDDYEQESTNSILLTYIKHYEKDKNFIFQEDEVVQALKELRDFMAKMWLYFKERQFKYAVKKLNEITSFSIEDPNYRKKITEYLDKLIPIIAIYEIFNRPLSESVYPESISQTQRLGAHIARFLTSRFNPIGFNIMDLFNRLAYHNWSHLIIKKNLSFKQFFNLVVRLPIWKHIPAKIKMKILSDYN
jgi:hypothetical protein